MTDYPDKKPRESGWERRARQLYKSVPKDINQAYLWQERKRLMVNRAKLKALEARFALTSQQCNHTWGKSGGSAFGAVTTEGGGFDGFPPVPVHTCLICDKTFEVMRKP